MVKYSWEQLKPHRSLFLPEKEMHAYVPCISCFEVYKTLKYAELMHGVEKSMAIERNRVAITMFLSPITILDFDTYAAEEYGRIRAVLERKGTPIGPMDMLIAAYAKAEDLISYKQYSRIRTSGRSGSRRLDKGIINQE